MNATLESPSSAEQEASALLRTLSTVWQPIATAPTSGDIRLWWRHAGECIGHFAVDEDWTPNKATPQCGFKGEADEVIPANQDDCTHWMLTSEPPPGQEWPHFPGTSAPQANLRKAMLFRATMDKLNSRAQGAAARTGLEGLQKGAQ